MRFFSRNIILFIPLVLLFSCLEPYEPEIPGGSDVFLVVDGVITNKPGPYSIMVTKSFALNSDDAEGINVTGLTISIEEENGPIETLVETEAGIYQTSTLQGKIGSRYRLTFYYEGDQFQSSWETINGSIPIDSVYYNLETRETTDKETEITGVQFYIDSQGSSQDATYYRYEWEETWEIGVFYPSYFDYVGNDNSVITTDPRHTCWKYNTQLEINIITTEALSENIISGHSLPFITGEDERFVEKYSLLVKQYALDEDEYIFWKSLKESNEELGSLYDKQPGNIKGNIFNLSSPNELILGYFSASGLQEERVFIDSLHELSQRSGCGIPLDTLIKDDIGANYESLVLAEIQRGKFFFDFVFPMTAIEPLGVYLSDPICSDCQLKGGDVNKPIYWDD